MTFLELNADQRRETINTQQRFQAWREATERAASFRGSMVWAQSKGQDYLARSAYERSGPRRQTSLGVRSPDTERIKSEFDRGRAEAQARVEALRPLMARQAAVNRALGLGRVPRLGAQIVRALASHNLLGAGIRVLGTYALYAYEAAAGIRIDTALMTTEDLDLLLDTRARLSIIASDDIEAISLLRILKRVDRSFERSRQTFRAINRDGYMVDLVKPLRRPPWTQESTRLGADVEDLVALEIDGLEWLESAPAFEAVVIDDRGEPLRMTVGDPRVFAAHKHWLSARDDREPIKRRRDGEQAKVVASLVVSYLPHLAYEPGALRMLPRDVFADARPLFARPT